MEKKKLRPIMFVGTCSDAGKSLLATAFCRIFRQDGYRPAPFKAQNMSLNSYATPEGGEIGRAQAVQAEACGMASHADMNPVLIKPSTGQMAQVVLNGRPVGHISARDYFRADPTPWFTAAIEAFRRLETEHEPIVLEGAGSISELNLRERDITNMRMAQAVGAATYLVADIDRGGVFASVYGSIMLLPEEERRLIKGIIINKFRGDESLFDKGRQMIHELTGVLVVGVIPYWRDLHIEEEDSVALDAKPTTAVTDGRINVAVIRLPHLSNFTDFRAMEWDGRFHVYYTTDALEVDKADIVILPGTKSTIADLLAIRENGVAEAVIRAHRQGKRVIGICGGYQMMGRRVDDPLCAESPEKTAKGLDILPVMTIIYSEKKVGQNRFRYKGETECYGYQIHMGATVILNDAESLNLLPDGTDEGCRVSDRCWGTYMHGILDNAVVLDDLAGGMGESRGDYRAFKERQYDLLAERVRRAVDMKSIYSTLFV